MKKTLTLLFLSVLVSAFTFAQVHVGAKFIPKKTTTKPDSAWFTNIGIRGAWIAPDLDKDGKPELILTDYDKRGRVHVFQAVGNDSIEWIWSSPFLDTLGGDSSPRTIRTGDLDGDGKGEIIFPSTGFGYLIFEWNGVAGSHKFGTKPSAIIPNNVTYGSNFGPKAGLPHESNNISRRIENFEVFDIDKDGVQELLTPVNRVGFRDFLIISAIGEWEFENQGFASFQIEGSTNLLASTKFGGGTPYAIAPADLDGDGKYEIVCHNWNFGNYWVMKVTGPDTYILPDTAEANATKFYYQDPTKVNDVVSLFGITVADFDKDGNQEVYFPWYKSYQEPQPGFSLHMINYSPGNNVLVADSTHSFNISDAVSLDEAGETVSSFMGVVGDLDRNGKNELIIGSFYPSTVVAMEFQGGDITKSVNYLKKVYYKGENDSYATLNYFDSLGTKYTTFTRDESFPSKPTRPIDFDGDGKLEIILPFQGVWDSTLVTWKHFDVASNAFVTDSSKNISNPKKWIFRSLEADIAGSVKSKDLTVITPDDYQLNQNYPNPFNPTTNINFVLPLNKKVTAKIYDMLGKEVRTLLNNEFLEKGSHTVTWNGRDNSGKQVASGAYIFKMAAGNVEKSMKMMLVK